MATILLAALLLGQNAPMQKTAVDAKSVHDFVVKDIQGRDVPLSKFKGKALLIVNVASKCGLTPQYAGLEALYKEKKAQGLVVLGFPANEFAGQEPGTNSEILTFCQSNYGVTFPMFSKMVVKGDDTSELYKWLIAKSDRPKEEIEWNFAKFVIGRDGQLVARLSPRDTPDSKPLLEAVNKALAKK